MMEKERTQIEVESAQVMADVFGTLDGNVKLVESELGVNIFRRDGYIVISGDEDKRSLAETILRRAISASKSGSSVTRQSIYYLMQDVLQRDFDDAAAPSQGDYVCITARGRKIEPKTAGQKAYIEGIRKNDIMFAIGPAGTGKTFLAVAMACVALRNKEVSRIVLTRPAVEAGEKLGFLPGDLQSKVDPYLRPLYDALYEIMGQEVFQRNMEKGIIEIAPLAYMRGRTLDDSFIILDEAQNTTTEQMKMFLTRMGFGSKMVVTGDVTQIDFPDGKRSGLKYVSRILKDIDGIAFSTLSERDVVRHALVKKIIKAFDKYSDK